ncbi:PH domain-containing protein [Actinokineospora inagensis]|uniref:PH domain-containing protein n=1 Tax=Actinokineospora inagensis TaxID=103730 RepID=UPI000401D9B9|nr:PH domain-containing protein [Actinokineospora inagensis]
MSAEWGRLDARMIVVRPLNELIGLVPPLAALVFLGNFDTWRTVTSVIVVGLILSRGLLSWATTKYRITDTRVELHKGVLFRQRLAIPRDRVRTVDLTAKLGHRLFGLAAVRIGTGHHEKDREGVTLDAVTAGEAERLRRVILRRVVAAEGAPQDDGVLISKLDNRWYRYAPLTMSGLLSIGVVVGFLMNIAHELDLRFSDVGLVRSIFTWVSRTDVGEVVPVVGVFVLVLSVLASLVGYLLQNHDYRLTSHSDHTIRVQRGLLTTRSVSIEEKRLRGAVLHEPLLLRAGHGARVSAVTTGLHTKGGSSQLLPAAPREEADRVAAEILRQPHTPTAAPLTKHPAKAKTRRLVRAIVPTVVIAAFLSLMTVVANWPVWLAVIAIVLIPAFVLVGLDRYRNLGHALTDDYLVSRSGSLDRNTVALQRTGIIGWTIRRTIFQRRARVFTLTAVTAAGAGGYRVRDLGNQQGIELVDATVPDLLTPFLKH